MVMLKERTIDQCQNRQLQIKQNEQGKVKDHVKDGKTTLKRICVMGINKSGNVQRR